MPTDDVRARLESELAYHRAKVLELAEEARDILAEDLEVFVTRKVKEVFLADVEAAGAMTDASLATLKGRTAEVARQARDRILTALADEALWLEPGDLPPEPRGLAANARVWAVVGGVADAVSQVAREFHLKPPAEAPVYQEPRRFIHSRLLTTVTERYWGALQALSKVAAEIAEGDRVRREDELSRRWDETPGA
jgi:hypothetical protein